MDFLLQQDNASMLQIIRFSCIYLLTHCLWSAGMATDSGVGGSVGDNLTSLAITQRLFSPAAHDLVALALTRCPDQRPTADELLHHQFVRYTRKLNGTLPQYLHPVVPITQQTEIGKYFISGKYFLKTGNGSRKLHEKPIFEPL